MILIRTILLCLSLFVSLGSVHAQEKRSTNQLDDKGNKHGMWYHYIKGEKGNPTYSEFGNYYHGEKDGPWYKMDERNDLVAIENFKYNVFSGEVKYYFQGQLTCVGVYRALNPDVKVDTIVVEDPVSGRQELKTVSSDIGSVRHGTWRYYNEETGALEKVEEYQVDELVYEEEFKYSEKDSLYYRLRAPKMPHAINTRYQPPASKQFNYNH